MKKQLLVALAAGFIGTSAMAQSAFEGFYGQLGVGYENDTFGSPAINVGTHSNGSGGGSSGWSNGNSSSKGGFSGAIGLGYNMSIAPQFLLGLGVDYNPLSITSSNSTLGDSGGYSNGKVSNRFNVFVTPGYEIDKDKLVYLKAGYSMEKVQSNINNVWQNNYNQSSNASGYIVGLGYKQLLDKNLYFFGEGNYMGYSQTTLNSQAMVTGNSGGDTQSLQTRVTPSAYQFLVGVGYKF